MQKSCFCHDVFASEAACAHWLFFANFISTFDIPQLNVHGLAPLGLRQLVHLSMHLKYHKLHFLFCLKIIEADDVMEPNDVKQANSGEKSRYMWVPGMDLRQ